MADARELIQRISDFRAALNARRAADTAKIALDLKGMIQRRVQMKGENSEGQAFKPYTPKYAKFRQDRNRTSPHVNFTFTGDLWGDVKPVLESEAATSVRFSITATRADNLDKLRGAAKYRSNILVPNQAEIDEAERANQLRAQRLAESFNIPFKIV